jgi:hypothetical protein
MLILSIVKVCKWVLTWVVRLTMLLPLLLLRPFWEWADYQYDNLEDWLWELNNP